ncbi:MAG: hypothetical protein AAF772_17085 [Acidobacteriota bacterium]
MHPTQPPSTAVLLPSSALLTSVDVRPSNDPVSLIGPLDDGAAPPAPGEHALALLTDDDGSKKSIIVYDGEAYEADGVIDKDEWTVGGAEVIKKRKLKRARPKMRRKAKKKGFDNNLGVNIELREKKRAKSLDVTF